MEVKSIMEQNQIRLAGIIYESLTNGPGMRRVLFSQGCRHNCKGCFNQTTHDFKGGEIKDLKSLVQDINKNPLLSGVTFSGGDPFEQADKFAYIAKNVRKTGKNVWCYTGYTFEQLLNDKCPNHGWKELLENTDVLVDGRFDINKKQEGLKFRGSSNQRLIDVKKSLKEDKVILFG